MTSKSVSQIWKYLFYLRKFCVQKLTGESDDDKNTCEGGPAWGGSGGKQHKLALGVCFPWEGLREGTAMLLKGSLREKGRITRQSVLAGGRPRTPVGAGGGSLQPWLGGSCVQLS